MDTKRRNNYDDDSYEEDDTKSQMMLSLLKNHIERRIALRKEKGQTVLLANDNKVKKTL